MITPAFSLTATERVLPKLALNFTAANLDSRITFTRSLATVTQARLGNDGTNYLNGWLQNLSYWPQRITDAETQAFST